MTVYIYFTFIQSGSELFSSFTNSQAAGYHPTCGQEELQNNKFILVALIM